MMCLFILLVILNRQPEVHKLTVVEDTIAHDDDLFNGIHEVSPEREVIYVDRHPVGVVRDRGVGHDYGVGIVLDDDPDVIVIRDDIVDTIAVVDNPDHVVIDGRNDGIVIHDRDVISGTVGGIGGPDIVGRHKGRGDRGSRHSVDGVSDRVIDNDIGVVDIAALDRAVYDKTLLDKRLLELEENEIGIDVDEDFGNLTLAKDNDSNFELDADALGADGAGGKGYGLDKGELYAYNFPSQGVGAGIGSPAVGAGVGAAGLGAGIGEAVLKGQAVPTLGGIGTSALPPLEGVAADAPSSDGVGGLACGAGAGGAAGLVTRMVTEGLGLGVGKGVGIGGNGGYGDGEGHGYNYDHLPRDGALHIMMHVDGSGSILNTRKQLDLMKDTLLKGALLPYYNNDEQLYDRRVTIVDGNGERTLQFFNMATTKDNVLAVVFQDEAAPAYHLPNFNKRPEDHYLDDLNKLKSNLNGYGGLYRGIMFQVDRGRTFAKSFKEFVECAWQGSGYLKNDNLKKYYWEENRHHIKNKDGVVFSDEYHAQSDGDPQYYLDLLFNASKKVGLDLNIYGAGQTDGKGVNND